MKNIFLISIVSIVCMVWLIACNDVNIESSKTIHDSVKTQSIEDTSGTADSLSSRGPSRNPASVDNDSTSSDPKNVFKPDEVIAKGDSIILNKLEILTIPKGTALVFCPSKMIRDIPSFVNASISKKELNAAYADFKRKIEDQNPSMKTEKIDPAIKSGDINLYPRMMVVLEYDKDEFKLLSGDEKDIKEFNKKNTLEWDWVVKPLQSTRRSIVTLKFYGVDDKNREELVHEKTIDITVTVDVRSYIDKWKDFLLEDSKTTITAILIPLITFFGGFISGKKKK